MNPIPLSEADTRAKLIDPAIHCCGWTEDLIRREETAAAIEIIDGRPRKRSRGRVDYLLRVRVNRETQPVAVALIEAKAAHLPPNHGLEQGKLYAACKRLKAQDLATGRAWAIKENLRRLWGYVSRTWAVKHWKSWNFWATHSRLAPVIRVARMIQNHLTNILTYFGHRITNAVSEGLHSKIQTIKQMACGFRNREHFKTAIYFHCGGLDLYPAPHGNP